MSAAQWEVQRRVGNAYAVSWLVRKDGTTVRNERGRIKWFRSYEVAASVAEKLNAADAAKAAA